LKRKIIVLLLIAIAIISILVVFFVTKNKGKDNTLTKVKLAEVTHSSFYAPLYVAIRKRFF
jgi:hypothetical protein